jgi:hypothetical protein
MLVNFLKKAFTVAFWENPMATSVQQVRVQHYMRTNDVCNFVTLLNSPELLEATTRPHERIRLFPATETLSMFMMQAMKPDRSCQGIVNDAAIKRQLSGLSPSSTNTGAYCNARLRLPLNMVTGLVRKTGKLISEKSAVGWRWQGRRVKLVDGTTVTMHDTPANQKSYPQQSAQKEGLGYPICRIVGITCLSSGAVLDAVMGAYKGKGTGEQALLRTMIDTFEKDDVVLGDAFYATYFLLAELMSRGVDAVFEQHGSRRLVTDFRRGKRIGTRDHLITLTKPKKRPDWMTPEQFAAAPDTIITRELDVGGRVLVTTLLCPEITPKTTLKELYKRRWNVELDIRNIKTTMGMVTLSCKTPEMVEKEMWVYLLAYNLIRFLMLQSALLKDVLARTLSFKHTLQLWLAWSSASARSDEKENIDTLLNLITQKEVGKRTGRIEPRAIKRRPKPYPMLMQTRAAAREKVRKFGHPKKLK